MVIEKNRFWEDKNDVQPLLDSAFPCLGSGDASRGARSPLDALGNCGGGCGVGRDDLWRNYRPSLSRIVSAEEGNEVLGAERSREMTTMSLSSQQWKSGVAAWLGWLFDGLDMHLYTVVAPVFVALLLGGTQPDLARREGESGVHPGGVPGRVGAGRGVLRAARRPSGPQPRPQPDDPDLRALHRPLVFRADLAAASGFSVCRRARHRGRVGRRLGASLGNLAEKLAKLDRLRAPDGRQYRRPARVADHLPHGRTRALGLRRGDSPRALSLLDSKKRPRNGRVARGPHRKRKTARNRRSVSGRDALHHPAHDRGLRGVADGLVGVPVLESPVPPESPRSAGRSAGSLSRSSRAVRSPESSGFRFWGTSSPGGSRVAWATARPSR